MWHQVIGHLAFHMAGCMKAALLAAVRGGRWGGWGDDSPPTESNKQIIKRKWEIRKERKKPKIEER